MTVPFTVYDGVNDSTLIDALLAPNSGITVSSISITLNASAPSAVNLYDGSLTALGIGAGLLLTTGTTPESSNTVGWFGTDNGANGDTDIDAVVNTVFQTQSFDATTLSFDFTVADPNATSVSFDIIFGSDEYPEWVNQFVDSAVVIVNGVNYALFNHDPSHPLSVISSNLATGYFQDNTGNVLPIEYDGVSHVLKIVAPINTGGATNHIKIGIADTGDHVYDSGIFLANFAAGNIPGSGVVSVPTTGTDNSDNMTGSSKDEFFDLKAGDDTVYAGAGDDIVVAGAGNDAVYGGSGNDQIKGDGGDDYLDGGDGLLDTAIFSGVSTDYTVESVGSGYIVTDSKTGSISDGTDVLKNIEYAQFSDGLFSIGVNGDLTAVSNPNTPPSNTAGTVVISGIGSEGNTLTAIVNDVDGISGIISYQWQISTDNGATWSDIGTDSNTYTVLNTDVGKIQVIASYTDDGATAESPISSAKSILQASNGDLTVTLMQLTAPQGGSDINPITTLIKNAIDLGISANEATISIKTVLGLPTDLDLKTYDSYAALLANASDATALAVEKIAVQIAVLTSLSSDELGVNLTLNILNAAANNQTLNLGNANDLANILGVTITAGQDKNTYPQPLKEIFDRNSNIDQSTTVANIEQEWQDLLGIQNGINSTSIADLNIHVNQVPIGTATAVLANGLENADYIVSANDLLSGFSDTDGGTLSVSNIIASNDATVTDNNDGTFTITPPVNYIGPIELNYTVSDGQGGSVAANQLFGIIANQSNTGNNPPEGSAIAVLADGTTNVDYIVSVADLLLGFSDADYDTLNVTDLVASNGTLVDNGDGTFTITPTTSFNGTVTLDYNVIDGNGGSIAATLSYNITNSDPTGSATAVFSDGTEEIAYTVSIANLLLGFSDINGDTLNVSNLTASNGTVVHNANSTFTITPTLNFNGTVTLNYDVIDGNGGSIAATQSYTLSAVNDAPTGSATVILDNGTEDKAYLVSASDLLLGFSDIDGDTLSVSNLTSSNGVVINNDNGTFTITPTSNFNGTVTLSYNAVDGHGGSIAATRSYTLAAVNDAPTGSATAVLTHGTEDTAYTVSATNLLLGFSDVEGNTLIVSNLSSSNGSIINNGNGTFTITPTANFNGAVTLNYDVIDGNGGSIAATQSYTLNAVNDVPTGSATATLTNGTEDTAYIVSAANLLLGFSDVDGDTLSVSNLSASNGSVTNNGNGTFTITPTSNFNGTVTLSYNAIDGHGGSVAATRGYTLAAVNDAPTGSATATLTAGIINIDYTVSASNLLTGFSDADVDTLSVSELSASNGVVNDNGDGTFTIKPTLDFNGVMTLNYNVIDGNGGSIIATQNYTVAPANSAPTNLAISASSINENVAAGSVIGTFSSTDPDAGNTFTYSLASGGTDNSAFSIVGNQLKINSSPDFETKASYNILVRTTDQGGLFFDKALTININNLNETPPNHAPVLTAPDAINYTDTAFDDTFATVSKSLVATDADGNALTYGITGGTDNGLTVSKISTYGTLTVTKSSGAYNFVANDAAIEALTKAASTSFTVTTSDGLLSNSKTLKINIAQSGITESTGNDTLTGTSGNDKFDALAGADKMTGGLGNDTYVVDNSGDTVVEISTLATEIDSVNSSVTYTLAANVENLTLIGIATIDGMGNELNNTLVGNTSANRLDGGLGSDVINGGTGDDTLDGGVSDVKTTGVIDKLNGDAGNDTFLVRGFYGAGIYTGGDGSDLIDFSQADSYTAGRRSAEGAGVNVDLSTGNAFSYYLKATGFTDTNGQITFTGIENVRGSIKADSLTGDTNANILYGEAGGDIISGLAGNDTLIGGIGNDTLKGGLGIDTTDYSSAGEAVTVNLSLTTAQVVGIISGSDTLIGIENLIGSSLGDTLTGDIAANNIKGGDGADTIRGGQGDDTLNGDEGNDVLIGGGGNDILTGGTGQDSFLLNSLAFKDTITDFVVADDTVQLAASVFTQLTTIGVLNSANFKIGAVAADANDYLVYNNTTGALFYDADGSGAGAAVQIALLGTNLALTNADFVIV